MTELPTPEQRALIPQITKYMMENRELPGMIIPRSFVRAIAYLAYEDQGVYELMNMYVDDTDDRTAIFLVLVTALSEYTCPIQN